MAESRASAQYPIAWWRQFVVLVRRTALCTLRNITLTRFRLLGHLLFGLTIGSVFYDVGDDGAKVLSNVSCLILFLMFIVFANAMTVVLTCKGKLACKCSCKSTNLQHTIIPLLYLQSPLRWPYLCGSTRATTTQCPPTTARSW